METYILKIGGSSITEKNANLCEAREVVIRRIAREIKKAKAEKGFSLVVVHGAGPFGHKFVKEYGINNGIAGEKAVEGFVKTHNSVAELDGILVRILMEEGLLAFPIQPSAFMAQEKKKIDRFDTSIIKGVLKIDKNIIPVLYGDMVLDKTLGASVVSGDALVPKLAKGLNASKVFMGTDVGGIFTSDPKIDKNAKIIPKIDNGNFEKIIGNVGEASTVDVTGGMKGKIMQIRENLPGVDVVIFNIVAEGNAYKALAGIDFPCTRIRF